ncbi:zinc ribbon domain-containing protein [Mycobacterium sp. CVI_P3]|uniref:Zinc ribbon domain-containing protein n=1 Tax=Mycobacterium pinniadriaticum TaxID=2994102 RepID=A0ABT3SBJ8_9MYCO|nr:zinc ribbon domain-containing protein [Mycobacterium pinniadriaticum]MCX2930436.1 zinc ribbon domain-containing protein [Mycobacterium pinniadriaticum]MCX2936860.1 zinc ribbon domain-containing protein [Mycobacterium pinniadriaticum]
MTSSLFPRLPRSSRNRFRAALILLVVALGGLALSRWQAAMIATAAFGLPILFVIYLRQIDIRRTVGVRNAVVSAATGLGLGVGWALVAGPIVAKAYDAALGAHTDAAQVVLYGIVVPLSEAFVMILPAVVVRVLDRSTREILGGFAIGALGATACTAAATLTLLLPQLAMGVRAPYLPVGSLLVEAAVEGLAWPLVGVAVGGIVGVALWSTSLPTMSCRYRGVVPGAVLVTVIVVAAMGVVDVIPVPSELYGVLHLLIAGLAVVVLRIVISAALIHEARGNTRANGTSTCAECQHLAAHAAFCSECGVVFRAPSQTTGGYGGVLGPLAGGLAAVVAAGVVASVLITPAPKAVVCPPDCGRPPLGTPVETNPRFSGDDGAFSVSYPEEGSAYEVTFDPPGLHGVELTYLGGDTGTLTLFGEPAAGRTPEQIAQRLISSTYPGVAVDYEIPNASVGYQPGYGVVADVYPQDSAATYTRLRVIVMVAVKHDYALIAAAVGPYHQFSPDYGTGHPSGANLELAMDMGKYVNSFRWGGDRYRRPS